MIHLNDYMIPHEDPSHIFFLVQYATVVLKYIYVYTHSYIRIHTHTHTLPTITTLNAQIPVSNETGPAAIGRDLQADGCQLVPHLYV